MIKELLQRFFLWSSIFFWNVVAFAQEKDIDINVRSEGDGGLFSGNLFWLLLLVGVVVILIIGLSLRGSGHTHVEEAHDHHHHN